MSKPNGYTETIPAIYKAQTFDVMLFTFVYATRHHLPSITIQEAVRSFQGQFKISTELIDIDACVCIYHRMLKKHRDSERTDNGK